MTGRRGVVEEVAIVVVRVRVDTRDFSSYHIVAQARERDHAE